MLPADDIWNARVDGLPVHSRSTAYLDSIGRATGLKADFGSGLWQGGPIGIPFVTVASSQPRVSARFLYTDESDPGPYPVPTNAPIEGGTTADGDRHVLVVDQESCVLYELFRAFPRADGSWDADSGAVFPLRSHALRPAGWTSADAAGLPILPGLARYDEVAAGQVGHALRFTAALTQRAYVWPARHYASRNTDPNVPPMGTRVRLKAAFPISGFSPRNQAILQALKTHGMILADNGSNWYISGAPDERWDNDELRALAAVRGEHFEVVDTASLMLHPDSGQVRGSAPVSTPATTPTATTTATATATATATPTATAMATATASPTTAPSPTATATPSGPTDRTLVLQGSAALPDTWITPDQPTTTFGALGQAHLQGSYTPDRLLILPKLTGLPTGATVQRATLAVYADGANSVGDTLAAHQISKTWSPTTATYRRPWRSPGMKAGTDYVATPVGTATVGGVGWLEVDVTAAPRSWLAGSPNRGLMLRLAGGSPAAHYRVHLADSSNLALRPRLTVVYR